MQYPQIKQVSFTFEKKIGRKVKYPKPTNGSDTLVDRLPFKYSKLHIYIQSMMDESELGSLGL
jgi:hypothetical protein